MPLIDPDLLLRAYAIGVFPMSDGRNTREVYWVEPKRRAIMPLDGFHLSKSLRKTLRSGRFAVTANTAFTEVIRACAMREETWINGDIERSYVELQRLGHAHSVETWLDGKLVGGLYGVSLGSAFFGESMFSTAADASKVALAWLVARMRVGGYTLLDCQFMTEHLRSLGAIEIPQEAYLALLDSAVGLEGLGGAGVSVGVSAGASAGAASLRSERRGAAFDALDALLSASAADTLDAAESGCVISQLLGQTSQIGCSTTFSEGDSLYSQPENTR